MIRFRHMAARFVAIVSLAGFRGHRAFAAGVDTAKFNQPHKPFQIYGNTYYVGTEASRPS